MKAFIINNPQDFEFGEVPTPPCGRGDVMLKVLHVGICGSDVEILNGDRPRTHVRYPIVPGHEWVGEVVDTGADVTDLHRGQLAVVEGLVYCGQCANCRRGATNLCLSTYDEIGFTRSGAFGQYVAAPRRFVCPVELGSGVEARELALVEPCACAVNAGLTAGLAPGDRVAVIGSGTVGLLVCQYVRLNRPGALVVFDKDPARLFLAREMGATEVASVEAAGAYAASFDVVFEAAGNPQAVQTALLLGRKGGRVVLLGIAGGSRTFALESDVFVLKGLQVSGIFSYTSRAFKHAAELVSQGKIRGGPLVDRVVPFCDAAVAIKAVGRGNMARPKILIQME